MMVIIIVSTSIVFISHVFIPIVIMKDLAQIKKNRLLLLLMMSMMMTKMMMVMKKMMRIKIHMMNILSMVMMMTSGSGTSNRDNDSSNYYTNSENEKNSKYGENISAIDSVFCNIEVSTDSHGDGDYNVNNKNNSGIIAVESSSSTGSLHQAVILCFRV